MERIEARSVPGADHQRQIPTAIRTRAAAAIASQTRPRDRRSRVSRCRGRGTVAVPLTANTPTARGTFFRSCSPSERVSMFGWFWIECCTSSEMQIPPGSASGRMREATLTPSP